MASFFFWKTLPMSMMMMMLALSVLPVAVSGYDQDSENDYLKNFKSHMASSYFEGDHTKTLNVCRSSPSYRDRHTITVRPTSGSNLLTSSEVQSQCHKSYLCVIPPTVIVQMTSSLHVGALEIQGKLYWNDETQSQSEAYLCAGYVVTTNGGTFSLKLQSNRKQAWIYLVDNGAYHNGLGWRAFGGMGASMVEVIGRPLQRTWTLLDEPLQIGDSTMVVLHDPMAMGWQVGDRIGIAPMEIQSKGTGQTFTITDMDSDGTIRLDRSSLYNHKAEFLPSQVPDQMPPVLMSAEVINLSRNIIITGDDFENIPCDPDVTNEVEGCMCTDYRTTCTVGLHTAMALSGILRVANTRVEKCGQRGILGKYCLHFHNLKDCPDCLLSGNAIESSQQRAIVIHGTHRTLVERNVLWNVRGAGIYVEGGNEMYNSLEYNVAICPYPLDDPIHHGCTLPGTQNGNADDRRNQAGFYLRSSTNDMIGNRAANSRNGMYADPGADGDAEGQVCAQQTTIGRWEGNTFHGHARFGTYPIRFYPKDTDRSVATNGLNLDEDSCNGFDKRGDTTSRPTAIVNHVDYDNIFVGQYEVGDIQFRGHASLNNKNLMYWKETKNFGDGCAAHMTKSYYSNGNLALPDQATVIIQDTVLENVSLEANHHCDVGSTGFLCMPQYILHNVQWKNDNPNSKWMYFQDDKTNYGGIFSLSPNNSNRDSPFPAGYISLVSNQFSYLLSAPRDLCDTSSSLGYGRQYDNGILCKFPLRSFKIYTRGLRDDRNTPDLRVEVWFDNTSGIDAHSRVRPSVTQFYPFHQIGRRGDTNKQGYSFPVIPSMRVSYRLSLSSGNRNIPDDWVIEFSDPVVGNRWGEEFVQVELQGRSCTNNGVISSYHDRRFIYSGTEFLDDQVWGEHGACSDEKKMPSNSCRAQGDLEANECRELCGRGCDSDNSYCDCRTATCRCKAGFIGDDCSIDICTDTCGSQGQCTGLYLGATLPIENNQRICIDDRSISRRSLTEDIPKVSASAGLSSWLLLVICTGITLLHMLS